MMSNPTTFVSNLSKLKKLNMDLVIIYNNFSINDNYYYNHKFEVLKTCLTATFAFSRYKNNWTIKPSVFVFRFCSW